MRKVFRYAIFSLIFTFAVSVASVVDANGQELTEILRRLEAHNKSLQSVQANVSMIKHNPQLNVSDTYTGTTSYLPKIVAGKMYMRLDWAKPTVEQISVIGDEYELYKPSINQVYTGKVSKAKNSSSAGNALSFMNMSRDELRKNFNVSLVGSENLGDGMLTARILLAPKAVSSYKQAEIWVDKDGMVRQAKITEMNSDTTTVVLEGVRKNERINTKVFSLNAPKAAKRIKA